MLSFGSSKAREQEISMADVYFIRDNYSCMSVEEIVAIRGVTEHQVNRTVEQLRRRGLKLPFKREKPPGRTKA